MNELCVKINPDAPIRGFRDKGVRIKKGDDWSPLPERPGNRTKELIRRGVLITNIENPFGDKRLRSIDIPEGTH